MSAPSRRPVDALSLAAGFWFCTVALGQLAFLVYIAGFYGPTLVAGDFAQWARNEQLGHGYVAGDPTGNLMFAVHVGLAAVLTLGGLLQLLPALRRGAPTLHRWIGRIFMVGAILAAVGGAVLTWWRHTTESSLINDIGISGNALAILVCAFFACRAALRRDFGAHQGWAMRLFLVVSGVWFLRVGVMAWGIAGQGWGIGQFFDAWVFGSYLAPLVGYELYRRAQIGGSFARLAASGVLVVVGLIILVGAGGAWAFMWMPLILD
jgi:hypothetical protein